MKKKLILFSAIAIMMANSCKKDPEPVNEEELITTLILSVQETGSSTTQNFVFNDPDGAGGVAATIDSLILDKDATYNASITLLNTQETPADTISIEVLEEGTEHQFFYGSTPSTLISGLSYLAPFDTDGRPIGLNFDFDTQNANATGTFKVTLRHEPNKSASGVASGDITNADGETDIEVEFPVRLK